MDPPRAPLAWPQLLLAALTQATLLLITASDYGYHRDELYFREAGENLDFGFDDQPPLTPLIGRIAIELFGDTPRGMRVLSILAVAACVVLTGVLARELGGGRRAQTVAAWCLAASGLMFAGHIVSTATYDIFFWVLALTLFVRLMARGPTPGRWLALGLVAGLALQNKHLILLLAAAVLAGVVLARRGELLRGPWPWVAGGLAVLLWAPNLAWQAANGWPQLELAGQIADEDPIGMRITFLPLQLAIVSVFLTPVWFVGLRWLLRSRWRALGLAYLVLVAACLVTAAKPYYIAGFYSVLLAAGAVALEDWLAPARRRALLAAGVVAAGVTSALITLPLIPARDLASTPIPDMNEDALETIAWPELADAVARVHRDLSPSERERAVIFTANYGEAGALDRYGPARGLPEAFSGHNSYSDFGRPDDGAAPVILVGFHGAFVDDHFRDCRLAAQFDNGLDIENEEQGTQIHVCAGPAQPWSQMWPSLHHLHA